MISKCGRNYKSLHSVFIFKLNLISRIKFKKCIKNILRFLLTLNLKGIYLNQEDNINCQKALDYKIKWYQTGKTND